MALFKTTDEVAQYIKIDVNMKFAKLKTSIELAEMNFIKPILGAEFYKEVSEAYTEDSLSDELNAVLPYIQRALANYAAFSSIGELGVVVGDLGIQQIVNQNSQPAPAWKVNDLKIQYLTAADKSADLLLEFLELAAVIPDGQTEDQRLYKKWYDNKSANTALSGTIVYKTSIASKYIEINDSRRLFLRLKKVIQQIETGYISRLICSEQYNEIVGQLKANELSNENRELCNYLEPIIAKRALHNEFSTLPIIISSDGIFTLSVNSASASVITQKILATGQEKSLYMEQLKSNEITGFLSDEAALQKFLDANIDNYPLIKNSPCYNGTTTEVDEKWKIDNTPDATYFST